MNWTLVLLPSGIIMTFFVGLWIATNPTIVWTFLKFGYHDGKMDFIVSCGIWVWFIGAIATIYYLCSLLV